MLASLSPPLRALKSFFSLVQIPAWSDCMSTYMGSHTKECSVVHTCTQSWHLLVCTCICCLYVELAQNTHIPQSQYSQSISNYCSPIPITKYLYNQMKLQCAYCSLLSINFLNVKHLESIQYTFWTLTDPFSSFTHLPVSSCELP